jgi:hypothetical protein
MNSMISKAERREKARAKVNISSLKSVRNLNADSREIVDSVLKGLTRLQKIVKYIQQEFDEDLTEDEKEDADDDSDEHKSGEQQTVQVIPTHQFVRTHFKCNIVGCEKQLVSEASLKAHIKRHGLGLDMKCAFDGCNRSFKTKQELKIHLDSHTDEKKYHCDLCDCKYKQKQGLSHHKRKKHS